MRILSITQEQMLAYTGIKVLNSSDSPALTLSLLPIILNNLVTPYEIFLWSEYKPLFCVGSSLLPGSHPTCVTC